MTPDLHLFLPPTAAADASGRRDVSPTPDARMARLFEGARIRAFPAGSTLFLDGDPVEEFHQVVSGTVRCCTITSSGYRSIFRFARAGDYLAFADVDRWHFTGEAVDAVRTRTVPRAAIEQMIGTDPDLCRAVRSYLSAEFAARETLLAVLSQGRAEDRVLWFLRKFALKADGEGFCHLPMTRQDIGEHLGASLETVSRAISLLKRRGLIEMRGSDRYRLSPDAARSAA